MKISFFLIVTCDVLKMIVDIGKYTTFRSYTKTTVSLSAFSKIFM